MNPILIIQLGQLVLGDLIDWKNATLKNQTYAPQFQAALDTNTPLGQDVMDQLLAGDVAADAAVQNA